MYEQTSWWDDSGGGGGRVSGSEHFDLTRGRSGGRGKRSGSRSAFDSCNMCDRCQRLQHTARWFEIGNSGCRLRAHWFYHTSWPGHHNRLQRGRCSSHGNVSQLLTRCHRAFYSFHTFVLLNNEKLIQRRTWAEKNTIWVRVLTAGSSCFAKVAKMGLVVTTGVTGRIACPIG